MNSLKDMAIIEFSTSTSTVTNPGDQAGERRPQRERSKSEMAEQQNAGNWTAYDIACAETGLPARGHAQRSTHHRSLKRNFLTLAAAAAAASGRP